MGKILEVKNLTVHIKTHKGVVQAVRGVDFYLSEKEWRAYRGKDAAMIFQDPMTSLNPTMKVGKQIEEMLKEHRKEMSKADRKTRAIELLSLVGISNPEARYDQYPHQLSGGMRTPACQHETILPVNIFQSASYY